MVREKEYYAFISYKREDEKWAQWLQDKLEHYKFPTNLNGRTDLPKHIRPTFRDVTDLKPGLLADEINEALQNSEWLIVICSPRSAKSQWVCKEAQTFIDLGRADHIIPFVIEGTPFSGDPSAECYPDALLSLTGSHELLAANINEMGRDAAAIKVVARMFNLRFDALWQRYRREKRLERNWLITVAIAVILCLSALTYWMYWQNQQTKNANWKMMDNQARAVAEKAMRLVDDGDSYLARLLAIKVLPQNINNATDYPYTIDAEIALRKACSVESAILEGHKFQVTSVDFHPNGKVFASASSDGTVKIWDRMTGRNIERFNGYGLLESVAFSPNGKYLVAASQGKTVFIWDYSGTGELLTIIEDCTDCVGDKCFSHDGLYIISVPESNDRFILWNLKTGSIRMTLDAHSSKVSSAGFSPDGKKILSTSTDGYVKVWDVKTGKIILTLSGHKGGASYAEYSLDGKKILSVSGDNVVRIWNAKTGRLQHKFIGDEYDSYSFCPNAEQVLSCSNDHTIKIWDIKTGRIIQRLIGHQSWVGSASYSPDGNILVSASGDRTVRLWDIMTDKATKVVRYSDEDFLSSAILSPNGRTIASVHGYCIKLYDLQLDRVVQTLKGHTSWIRSLSFSSDGKHIVSASEDKTIRIWDTQTGDQICKPLLGHTSPVNSAVFSPDGKHIVSASDDNSIRIWDAKTGKSIGEPLVGHTAGVMSANYNSDGTIIVSASKDSTIRLWDSKKFELIKIVKGLRDCRGYFKHAAFNPSGTEIVTICNLDIIIWDVHSSRMVRTLQGHADYVASASYSPDGKWIISASPIDNTIRVWDAQTGKIENVYRGEGGLPNDASFSYDGTKIIASFNNGLIKIWDFPPLQELIDQTRERFKNRPLTPEERRKYYLE